MKSTFQPLTRRGFIRGCAALCMLVGLLWATGLRAQTAEEHASHHPGQAGSAAPAAGAMPAAPGAAPAMGEMPAAGGGLEPGGMGPPTGVGLPGGMGGMGDMGAMMKNMGKPPPKELYPTLMALPELSPDQREQVRGQADERMRSGVALFSEGLERLAQATENEDYAAMQEATAQVREALARFESGLAARRALAEGKPPRQVALQWFKDEMNLQPPQGVERRGSLFGVTPFHLFTMVLLIAFALAMVAMYFFKMRRAAALFGRIETDSGRPPPGSAPPLAGAPGPSAPVALPAEKAAPAGGALPPVAPADNAAPPAADAKAAPSAADGKMKARHAPRFTKRSSKR